jgi:hypothetical protein
MDFDGFSECWFVDQAAFQRALGSNEWQRMNDDADDLFELDYVVPKMSAVLEQRVIVERHDLGDAPA